MSSAHPLRECSLALGIDEVLTGSSGSAYLLVGHSPDEQGWLVALAGDDLGGRRWLCAPHSELAISCVRTGRALPADLFRHSGTGTVHVIAVAADGGIVESVRLCAEVNDDELLLPSRQVA